MINYNSPRDIDRVLTEAGYSFRRRFGQNFLINPGARATLVSRALSGDVSRLWEIGPGIGTLSVDLVSRCDELTLFEIDNGFVAILSTVFDASPAVRIVSGDFVHTWRAERARCGDPDVVVGNLPYNAATRILLDLFVHDLRSRVVITIPKELADRITAVPRTPSYSSFSIICQTGWRIERIGTLRPGSFYPKPTVVSSMLELVPAEPRLSFPRAFFLDFCRCLFSTRRKTIRNNLSRCDAVNKPDADAMNAILDAASVAPDDRSETLSADSVVDLAARWYEAIL